MSHPTFSFEYFPPKSEKAEEAFWAAAPKLAGLGPKFMTITYGAGGSTRDKTIAIAEKLHKQFADIPIAAHLTYLNSTKEYLYGITDALWTIGIRHIVALRGDLPEGLSWPLDFDENYFQHTSEFVEALVKRHGYEISVGAYPEKHPDAKDLSADIEALKKKCDAGATQAITQFFFENEKYYDFVEACQKAGITTPIYPGILPVHDFTGMIRFAARCQAQVPDWVKEKFAGLEDKPEEAKKIATEMLVEQTLDLVAGGVPHVHFYTLNKYEITDAAVKALKNSSQ
jgi:methylenetetrahydrofolate reductase (NADPH)